MPDNPAPDLETLRLMLDCRYREADIGLRTFQYLFIACALPPRI